MVLPSLFRKSSKSVQPDAAPKLAPGKPSTKSNPGTPGTPPSSPDKKSHSRVKDRERERRSSSYSSKRSSKYDRDSHPLNLPPEELRRLSALRTATMGSPREEAGEPMQESTPAPQQAPGAFPQTNGNGVSGDQSEQSGPAPPPHRSATSSPAQSSSPVQSTPVDAEACKEAGNKFFKAKQYDKAIEEYTKGSSI